MWYLIVFIASIAVSAALTPRPAEPKPAALGDINVPTAEPGRNIPISFGTVIFEDPNIVWYGDLSTYPVKSGGK